MKATLGLTCALALAACGKQEVAAAKEKLKDGAKAVGEAGREGLDKAKDGLEVVQDKVEDLVEPDPELTDAELLAAAKRGIKCKQDACTMPREVFDEMIERNELMADQAKTYEVQRGGATVGVELQKLGPIPKALGFKSGDVILDANGVALDSVQGLAKIYVELRTADTIAIGYRRGKKVRSKTIKFA